MVAASSNAALLRRPRSIAAEWARVGVVVAAVVLALASPALGVIQVRGESSEGALTRLLVASLGGFSLPLAGAAVAALSFATGTPIRARIDRIVAAGADPQRAILVPVGVALGVAMVASGAVALLLDVTVRARLGLAHGSIAFTDALESAWAVACGAAAWTALAIALVVRGAKGSRAFLVLGLDLPSRLLPGGAAWIAPSAHVENLLGGAPMTKSVEVPVLPQLASVVVLLAIAVVAAGVGARLYEGASRR